MQVRSREPSNFWIDLITGARMAKKIQDMRIGAFNQQAGRCWYCDCKMINGHTRSIRQYTAEHLVARSDGGSNKASNIVAACR